MAWQHFGNRSQIAVVHHRGAAQLAFVFGGFLGQNVAFERVGAFHAAVAQHFEAFFRAGFGFHFRHGKLRITYRIRQKEAEKSALETRCHGFCR